MWATEGYKQDLNAKGITVGVHLSLNVIIITFRNKSDMNLYKLTGTFKESDHVKFRLVSKGRSIYTI